MRVYTSHQAMEPTVLRRRAAGRVGRAGLGNALRVEVLVVDGGRDGERQGPTWRVKQGYNSVSFWSSRSTSSESA